MLTKREFNKQFRENKEIGLRNNFPTSKWLESQILREIHKVMAYLVDFLGKKGYRIVDDKWDAMWLRTAEVIREGRCLDEETPWRPDYVWVEAEWVEDDGGYEELEKDGVIVKA